MKAVSISDLHLDQSTAGVDRYPDVCSVIDQSVEHAIVRAHRSVAKLAQVRQRLSEHGIVSVAIAGNHDVLEDGSGGSVLDSLKYDGYGPVFTRPEFQELCDYDGRPLCNLLALPFTPTSHSYDPEAFVIGHAALNQPKVDLVIGHLNLEGITLGSETTDMPRGRDVFWPLKALRAHFPNAFLLGGHYHTQQVFNGVFIIGSGVRLNFAEKDNDAGFAVLEF